MRSEKHWGWGSAGPIAPAVWGLNYRLYIYKSDSQLIWKNSIKNISNDKVMPLYPSVISSKLQNLTQMHNSNFRYYNLLLAKQYLGGIWANVDPFLAHLS